MHSTPTGDTWYSAPMCQINWWIPIFDITPRNCMAFYPGYFSHTLRNSSETYNYQKWNELGRTDAASHVRSDSREQPKPKQKIEGQGTHLICPPAGMILFSAAHLHETVPNTSGIARYSIDFRTVHLDDVLAHNGARNLDSRCTGTTMRDYLCCMDLQHIPETAAQSYDGGTKGGGRPTCFGLGRGCLIVIDAVALVAGASSDIGKAITVGLVRAGAYVFALGRNNTKLMQVAADNDEHIIPVVADLTRGTDIVAVRDRLSQRGRLDILVLGSGIYERSSDPDALVRQLAANVQGPYALLEAMLPLLESSKGLVVFINSTQGLAASPGVGHFAATQHAMRALADSLRQEFNPKEFG